MFKWWKRAKQESAQWRRERDGTVCLWRGPGGLRHCGMVLNHKGDHAPHARRNSGPS